MKIEELPQELQKLGDGISVGAVVGAFLGWLPHLATLLTIVWMGIRISETKTVERLTEWIKSKFK